MQALSPSPARPSRREDGAPSGWDRYLDLLTRKQVPEQARRWYVARVEAFLKELRPTSLAKLTKEQITGYFQQASSGGQFAEWQFRQLVDAIGLLIVDLAQAPAGKAVDWDYWKEAGKPLGADHPAIARGQPSGPRLRRSAQWFPALIVDPATLGSLAPLRGAALSPLLRRCGSLRLADRRLMAVNPSGSCSDRGERPEL